MSKADEITREEIRIKAYKMKVKNFLKEVLDEQITKDTQIRYGAGYYTFYIEDFEFINNTNGTGLVIIKILNDEIEVFTDE